MKVLYDHQIFASQEYGGISRYFVEIASRIASEPGVTAAVLCPIHVNALLAEARTIQVHGKRIPRFPNSSAAMRILNATLNPLFTQARSDTSVYHETYFTRLDLAPRNAARVVTVHDMVHEKFPRNFSTLDRTRQAKRAAIERADHVICVSENTRRDLLLAIDLDPDRVSVVYHGSSLHMPEDGLRTTRQRRMLFVGGRRGYKNFTAFVQAFSASRLPAMAFSIACFGGGPFSSSEKMQFARLGISGAVHHVAGGDEKLAELLSDSAALVYPSIYEGFGIPPLEAMSCGCPVVCSNSSSLPEVVGNAAELFDPMDVDALRSAMESVALSPSRAVELINAGIKQASKFSWDRSAQDTLAVYRKATG